VSGPGRKQSGQRAGNLYDFLGTVTALQAAMRAIITSTSSAVVIRMLVSSEKSPYHSLRDCSDPACTASIRLRANIVGTEVMSENSGVRQTDGNFFLQNNDKLFTA